LLARLDFRFGSMLSKKELEEPSEQ
jgi:hypothetical protein